CVAACDPPPRHPGGGGGLGSAGLPAYRFALEGGRAEPEGGPFSRAALDHYRRMCATCHEHGLEPIVTYHHFTTPRWVVARGGWTEPATADRFARFCDRAPAPLGDLISRACTLNAPNLVATLAPRWALR